MGFQLSWNPPPFVTEEGVEEIEKLKPNLYVETAEYWEVINEENRKAAEKYNLIPPPPGGPDAGR